MDSSKEINPSDRDSGNPGAADSNSEKLSAAAGSEQPAGEAAQNAASAGANSTADAAKGSAEVKKPGSSLILLSPVTRKSNGAQAEAPYMAKDTASASFTAARAGNRPNKNWLKYGIPAALGLCLFGFGVAAGGQFFGAAVPAHPSVTASSTSTVAPKALHAYADQAEMRHLTKKLGDQIHALQARVESLRVAAKTSSPDEVREMKKSLDALRASIDSIKTQTNSSIAQLGGKVDRLQREQAKLQKPNERLSRNEHTDSADPVTTGSIARSATPNVKVASAQTGLASSKGHTQAAGAAVQPKRAPKLLVDWVVRDVYRGVALVEGPQGTFEVARGDPIPGGGTVESIERKNGGWILVTSRGIVGSVRN